MEPALSASSIASVVIETSALNPAARARQLVRRVRASKPLSSPAEPRARSTHQYRTGPFEAPIGRRRPLPLPDSGQRRPRFTRSSSRLFLGPARPSSTDFQARRPLHSRIQCLHSCTRAVRRRHARPAALLPATFTATTFAGASSPDFRWRPLAQARPLAPSATGRVRQRDGVALSVFAALRRAPAARFRACAVRGAKFSY